METGSGVIFSAVSSVLWLWKEYVSGIEAFNVSTFGPAWLPVSWLDLFNAVGGGMTVRAAMREKTHWLRVLIIVFWLTFGGTTTIAMLSGGRPRWWTDAGAFNALLLGYWLVFHCPGDLFVRWVWKSPGAQRLLPFVRGAAAALGMSAHTVERALDSWGPKEGAQVHTYVLLSVLGGCGGGLIVELLNLMLLPRALYASPQHGSSTAVLHSVGAALVYVLLLRDPAGLRLPERAVCALPQWAHAFAVNGTAAAHDLPCSLPWLPMSKYGAAAALSLLLIALHLIPAAPFNAAIHGALDALPGWKSTLVPSEVGRGGPLPAPEHEEPESSEDESWGSKAAAAESAAAGDHLASQFAAPQAAQGATGKPQPAAAPQSQAASASAPAGNPPTDDALVAFGYELASPPRPRYLRPLPHAYRQAAAAPPPASAAKPKAPASSGTGAGTFVDRLDDAALRPAPATAAVVGAGTGAVPTTPQPSTARKRRGGSQR